MKDEECLVIAVGIRRTKLKMFHSGVVCGLSTVKSIRIAHCHRKNGYQQKLKREEFHPSALLVKRINALNGTYELGS